MNSHTETLAAIPSAGYLGPARVLEIDQEEGLVQVLLQGSPPGKAWARQAMGERCALEWGHTVLVAGDGTDRFYIIGILDQRPSRPDNRKQIKLQSGARAAIEGPPDAEKLKIVSPAGEVVFEYDANTGRGRVDLPSGNLEILARNGNIDLVSAQGIRMFAKNAIEMSSSQGVQLAATDPNGADCAAMRLDPESIHLTSGQIGIQAERGDVRVADARFASRSLAANMGRVKMIADRLETVAGNVIQKATNMYRTVEQLTQLKTGRMRTLVAETCQLKSKRTFMKAEGDFKINGNKIHLG